MMSLTNNMQLDILSDIDLNEPNVIKQSKYYNIDEFHDLTEREKSDSLKVLNVNARSLVKNFSAYEMYFESLKSPSFDGFDIISFTETWLDDNLTQLTHLDDYSAVFKHKSNKKEGGGIAIFIKNSLTFVERPDLLMPADIQHACDCLFIELTSKKFERNIIIGIMYRSPRQNSEIVFKNCLNKILDTLSSQNKDVILLGDTNINLLKYKENKVASDYLDMLISCSYIPMITLPTRVTQTTATLIDHIFKKQSESSCIAGTLLNDISDHYINFLFLSCKKIQRKQPSSITYRPFTAHNIQNLNEALCNHNWNNVHNIHNPCNAYDEFFKTYTTYLNYHIPIKTVKFRHYKHKKESWMSTGLLTSIKNKDKLHYKLSHEKNTQKRILIEMKYKAYRNKLNSLIRIAKKMYWDNRFKSSINDMKATWLSINTVLNRSKRKQTIPDEVQCENNVYNTPKLVSEGFNNFFTNLGSNLAHLIPTTSTTATSYLSPVNFVNSFALYPTTIQEVQTILSKMQPKLSSGLDSISTKLIKDTCEGILSPLVHIINMSLMTGIVPKKMKIAKIIPIFKSGENNLIKNYRPISLLPSFSKILERVVYNRLYKYLISRKIITSSQFGFQKSKSTELAILQLQNQIISALSNNKQCIGIFLDLSKAFDTLNHSILLAKLNHYGIRGLALSWFADYLSDRKQLTVVNDCASEVSTVTCGVPQGSTLGPLLFLVYINDIINSCNQQKFILFADDTSILIESDCQHELKQIANTTLENTSKWLKTNKLSVNVQKTKFMHFFRPTSNEISSIKLKMNETELAEVSTYNFLGVEIDHKLKWNDHINTRANKISRINSLLYRLKYTLPESAMLNIYNALVVPHLTYGVTAWGAATSSLLKRLVVLQKKCLRAISNSRYNAHTDPIFQKYNILKFYDLYKLNCCKLCYRAKNKDLPSYFLDLLPLNNHINPHINRRSHEFYIFLVRCNLDKQMLNYRLGTEWNKLPRELKNQQSKFINAFVRKFKVHSISKYNSICTVRNCISCL